MRPGALQGGSACPWRRAARGGGDVGALAWGCSAQDDVCTHSAGLHSEQRALVDLLVLSKAKRFVGHPYSSLSVLVEQMRFAKEEEGEEPAYFAKLSLSTAPQTKELFDKFMRYARDVVS